MRVIFWIAVVMAAWPTSAASHDDGRFSGNPKMKAWFDKLASGKGVTQIRCFLPGAGA